GVRNLNFDLSKFPKYPIIAYLGDWGMSKFQIAYSNISEFLSAAAPAKEASRHFLNGRIHPLYQGVTKEGTSLRSTCVRSYFLLHTKRPRLNVATQKFTAAKYGISR